jgi:hypothetical protein
MPTGSLDAQAGSMQPTDIMDSQAEMAYRTAYLAGQFHQPGVRSRRQPVRSSLRRVHILRRSRTGLPD